MLNAQERIHTFFSFRFRDPNRRIEAPVFMKVIGDQELFEGYNALFKAVVSGKPEPEFKWLKNGGTIVAS